MILWRCGGTIPEYSLKQEVVLISKVIQAKMLWGLTHRTPFTNQIGVSSLVKQWLSIKYIQTCNKGSGGKDFKNTNVTGVSAMALLFHAFPRSCGQMKAGMTGRFLIEAAWCTVINGKCSGAKQRSLWLSRWQMGKPMGCLSKLWTNVGEFLLVVFCHICHISYKLPVSELLKSPMKNGRLYFRTNERTECVDMDRLVHQVHIKYGFCTYSLCIHACH